MPVCSYRLSLCRVTQTPAVFPRATRHQQGYYRYKYNMV